MRERELRVWVVHLHNSPTHRRQDTHTPNFQCIKRPTYYVQRKTLNTTRRGKNHAVNWGKNQNNSNTSQRHWLTHVWENYTHTSATQHSATEHFVRLDSVEQNTWRKYTQVFIRAQLYLTLLVFRSLNTISVCMCAHQRMYCVYICAFTFAS